MSKSRTLAILVFDDVEVLDFCGPVEVFPAAGAASAARPKLRRIN